MLLKKPFVFPEFLRVFASSRSYLFSLLPLPVLFAISAAHVQAAVPSTFPTTTRSLSQIVSGEQWFDNRGQLVQAHGGNVLRVGDTFYWFGEDRSRSNDRRLQYAACYSSKDLINWTFRRQVLQLADPENLGRRWKIERPKVFFNAKTNRFVMYAHIDGLEGGYSYAHVAVFTCDTVDGDYKYVHSFRPLGFESRDIGQFMDDDGSGYLIFESRPSGGFYLARLADDFLTVDRQVFFFHEPLEGGALVHYQGLYYVIGSLMSGWDPNPNKYATAAKLEGPWSDFKDIAPPETKTYGSQSSFVFKVVGTKTTSVIFCADMWRRYTLWDSRYLWMPLEIGNGNLRLPKPQPWSIDLKTGVVTLK
jgi:hypothetical protein